MTPQEEDSFLMKVLCGLLALLAAGVVALAAMAQSPVGTYEGRPVYDATTPVSAEVEALARLPIGEHGHVVDHKPARNQKFPVRRRRSRKGR